MVNACDLTANVTCGIQLGSPYSTSYNTLTKNLIMNCFVNGTVDCTISTSLNGIVSYATTTTNIFQNNTVQNCTIGFYVTTTGTPNKFLQNTAYSNTTQYSAGITNTASVTGFSTLPGVNVTIP